MRCGACRSRRKPGRRLGFAFRPMRALANPSPAALRLTIRGTARRIRNCACSNAAARCRRRGRCPSVPARDIDAGDAAMLWACVLLPQLALDGVLRRHRATGSSRSRWSPGRRNSASCCDAMPPRARPACIPGQPLRAAQALLPEFARRRITTRARTSAASFPRRLGLSLQLAWSAWKATMPSCWKSSAASACSGPGRGWSAAARRPARTGFPASHRDGADAARRLRAGRRAGWPGAHRTAASPASRWAACAGGAWHGYRTSSRARRWRAMGLRQLRQLFALPRAALARALRSGPAGTSGPHAGDRPDPRELYRPPDVFDVRIELNYEVSHHPGPAVPAAPPDQRPGRLSRRAAMAACSVS